MKTLDGKTVNVQDYIGRQSCHCRFGHPGVHRAKRELDAMTEIFPEWKENYKVELLAITIDDSRGLAKVPGIVTSKSWPFTVLADTKQELQQSLGFQTVPETFLWMVQVTLFIPIAVIMLRWWVWTGRKAKSWSKNHSMNRKRPPSKSGFFMAKQNAVQPQN